MEKYRPPDNDNVNNNKKGVKPKKRTFSRDKKGRLFKRATEEEEKVSRSDPERAKLFYTLRYQVGVEEF